MARRIGKTRIRQRIREITIAVVIAGCLYVTWSGPAFAEPSSLPEHRRQPVAGAIAADGQWLYVANQMSGTISVIDLDRQTAVAEWTLGSQPSDLVTLDENWLLLCDSAAHELRLIRARGAKLDIVASVRTTPYPLRIQLSNDGTTAYVSCQWARRVEAYRVDTKAQMVCRTHARDIDFAPREMVMLDDQKLLVADAFGGAIAILDGRNLSLIARRELPAHNMHGLAVTPDGQELVIAKQILSELAQTVRPDIQWGMLMSNNLRWMRIENLLATEEELFRDSRIHGIGEAGDATADPEHLAIRPDGTMAVALGGVDQVAIGRPFDARLARINVGDRPVDVVIDSCRDLLYVICAMDNAVDVVDVERRAHQGRISLGPRPEPSWEERGEALFYDGRLSMDGWMSCNSCHTDGHTTGLRNDNLGDDTFGAPKRILSLLGARNTEPYAWNGNSWSLALQMQKSVRSTMLGHEELTDSQADQMAEFVRSLEPPPGVDVLRGDVQPERVVQGRAVFDAQRCARCHQPPEFTSPRTYDVGFTDQLGVRRFNPPSLRGVSHRGPYLHDNRAKSLDELFQKYRHQLRAGTSDEDVQALIAFLRTL